MRKGGYTDGERIPQGTRIDHVRPGITPGGTKQPTTGAACLGRGKIGAGCSLGLDIMDEERFQTGWLQTQNYDVLEPILNEAMKCKMTEEWLKEFEMVEIACGPLNTINKVVADPQVSAREMIVEVQHPKAGNLKVVNTPI